MPYHDVPRLRRPARCLRSPLSASRDLGPADTVLIVGDYEAERPISEILKPITDRGTKCLWVPGNHDVDNSRWYDNTFKAMPTSNLHGTYRSAGGRIVGGLGGIFGETVWHFRFEMTPPTHQSPDAYMRTLRHQERWRKWLPLDKRALNFPET